MFIDTTVEKATDQEEGTLAYVDATSKEKSLANYLDPPDFLASAGLEDRLDEYKQKNHKKPLASEAREAKPQSRPS
jgi:hypothetical protein